MRERLIVAADARWQGGFGVVLGGPGLGKSTLVRQAMLESATLGRGREALVRCRTDWTATSVHDAICQQLAIANDASSVDPVPERIAEYLWSAAPERSGIVFDDLHHLDESGLAYVLALRDALPSNAHILIASRENPRLTALVMTADPSFVIDSGELLFTEPEVDRFASETNADRSALHAAGGWPAVLALTASAGSDVAGAYLYQKVLASLSRRQQGDLAVAAALGDLDDALARSVLEGNAADLVDIPLVHSPPGGGIMVHDLWKQPLDGLVDAARIQQARRTAATQAEMAGDVDRAVSILCQGGLVREAREVVLRHIAMGADRVPLDRVDRWLRMIVAPDQALLRQLLELLRSGLVVGSLSDAALDDINARCQQANERDLEAVVCEIRFAASWSADNSENCAAIADRLAELHAQGVQGAGHGTYLRDITLARSEGDSARVLDLIHAARHTLGEETTLPWNISLELETLVTLGRPFDALALLEQTEQRLAERKVRSVTYALTYWFTGRANQALRSLDSILREAGRFDGLERSWHATSDLFRCYRGLPNQERAPAPDDEEWFSLYSRVCEGLTRVAHAIERGDEQEAAELIGDLAKRLPPSGGFTLHAWFMGAAMWYGLRPEDRPLLDAFMTENFYGQAGALFRAFVAGREDGVIAREMLHNWPTAEQIGCLMPARWAAEVALRLPDTKAELRDAILDGLDDKGRPALDRLANGSDPALAELAARLLGNRPHAPAQSVTVRLLGPPALIVPGHDDAPDWRRGRVRALLGFLATRASTTRESAIQALWPDLDLQAGRRNLRVTMSYLTKSLEPGRAKSAQPWFVQADGERLQLRTEGLDLDVLRLQQALSDASLHQSSGVATKSIEALRSAVDAYGGDFLDGIDDEWIRDERSALARQAHNACLRLAALLQAGRSNEAEQWVRRAIEIDPLSIDAHEALIVALQHRPPHEIDTARARLVQLLNELN